MRSRRAALRSGGIRRCRVSFSESTMWQMEGSARGMVSSFLRRYLVRAGSAALVLIMIPVTSGSAATWVVPDNGRGPARHRIGSHATIFLHSAITAAHASAQSLHSFWCSACSRQIFSQSVHTPMHARARSGRCLES
jgi:hypothetical protein